MPFYLLYEHVWWGGGGVPRVGACCSQKTPSVLPFPCLGQGLLLLRRLTNETRLGRDPLLSTSHLVPPCLAFYLGSEVPSLGHQTCKASVVQPGPLFPPLFKDRLPLPILPSLPFHSSSLASQDLHQAASHQAALEGFRPCVRVGCRTEEAAEYLAVEVVHFWAETQLRH